MSRRRTRRRGSGPWSALTVVSLLVLAGFLAGGGVDSAAFDSGSASRGTAVDVTLDETGVHSLDTAGAVHVDATEPLVNVTNYLGRQVMVTVALRENSTHVGDLVVDGVDENDEASFSLGRDATETVRIDVVNDSSLAGETVYFHANATAEGLSVSAPDRSVPVEG